MGQVLFVVWRESFEALLVIGIICAWIKRHPDSRNGIKFLLGGVFVGVVVSILLALLIYGIFNVLDDTAQSLFVVFMEIIACILIVQTVYWMHKNGNSVKTAIESDIKYNIEKHNWWGVALIVIIVIAREGSEIVVFLSSFIMSLTSANASKFFMEIAGGIIMTLFTFYIFSLTSRFMSWRIYFKITGVILLFLALSLLLKGSEDVLNLLIELDYPITEFLIYPVWDTTALLDDSGIIGGVIRSFFAYRSQPVGLSIIIFIFYWILIFRLFSLNEKHA